MKLGVFSTKFLFQIAGFLDVVVFISVRINAMLMLVLVSRKHFEAALEFEPNELTR